MKTNSELMTALLSLPSGAQLSIGSEGDSLCVIQDGKMTEQTIAVGSLMEDFPEQFVVEEPDERTAHQLMLVGLGKWRLDTRDNVEACLENDGKRSVNSLSVSVGDANDTDPDTLLEECYVRMGVVLLSWMNGETIQWPLDPVSKEFHEHLCAGSLFTDVGHPYYGGPHVELSLREGPWPLGSAVLVYRRDDASTRPDEIYLLDRLKSGGSQLRDTGAPCAG